jgi:NAD(P)-dependent dehydrogenase (short-subunit alcohol dehydrogenase family)
MRGLQGKTVLVAGGAGKIGSAISLRLGAEGANVVVGSLHADKAQAVAEQVNATGGRAIATGLDIGDEAAVAAALTVTEAEFGGLDGVNVNGADMSLVLEDTDAESIALSVFDRTIHTNLRGYLIVTQQVLPKLRARGGGAIVYTSSQSAFLGEPSRPAYAMAKSGLNALVRHVASRWGKENIRANAVAPGATLSERDVAMIPPDYLEQMLAAARSPRLGKPEDSAAMVALLLSDDGEWVNGQVISVDGGTTIR